ncbi:nodulation protein E [Luteibacter sp. Sphag1AF]|uniref:beta-ketoacyl-[acyl-carrier-protein] synthase family protein n=1 Tax=Luteibacter sp. Sphag1AF TaxID=2587031 RepID=UPI001610D5F6|nr:beta-ketoacyl-[acyl-carrier-protein] synthase family protein [Luteibacter sp. Sphag1AF]MBB3225684.1 nodulation protein E [Luteibacter sp. Sphag1AF]
MSNRMERRVVLTGLGAVSAFGIGVDPLWGALSEGRSAIGPLRHPYAKDLKATIAAQLHDFRPEDHFDERVLPLLDRVSQFALLAAREAAKQAGLPHGGDNSHRTAVIVGTGAGGETSRDEQDRKLYGEGAVRVHPLSIVRIMTSAPCSHISMELGSTGPAFVVSSACASANHAICQAVALLRSGMADVAVTGGAEACLSFGVFRAWEAMRILADDTCRPFCKQRHGLVLGEGAAMFVLETLEHARGRGATILAEIAGTGMSADAGDIVAPSAEGAARAIQAALSDAGLSASDIGYINAHGTGTQANDVTETRAIHQVFGPRATEVPVSSTKSMHGHALGASGALELVAVVQALRNGILPPTANFLDPDPACDLDVIRNEPRRVQVAAALSHSFAFGGLNAVLAVRAPD